ncbi:MAG: hypothetical protein HKM93_22955 [Desulfobacteraceae bacterium]|nr:hypothetical protein [Desulfobacteraceae bacterium]
MTPPLSRLLIIVVCLFTVLCFHVSSVMSIEVKQQLEARFSYKVKWDFQEGDMKFQGSLSVHAKGILKINAQFASSSHDLPAAVMLPYAIDAMGGHYTYEEHVYNQNPPKDCPSLTEEYSGGGPLTIEKMPGPGNLIVNNLGAMMKASGVSGPAAAAMSKNMFDHYLLAFPGVKQKVTGRKLYLCKYIPAEKTIAVSNIGIRYLVPEDGKIDGKASWTTKTNTTPDFQVRVSNLPQHFEKKAYQPENKPGGVSYQLSWTVKEPVFIAIQRKVKGKWQDLETAGDLTEVVAGERMFLKGIASPESKTMSSSDWTIDGNNGENYIKEFKATDNHGEPLPMQPDDLDDQEVSFVWYKGDSGKVKLQATIDGEKYDKEVEFTISRPEYTVTWENSPDSHFGECVGGVKALQDKWPRENRNSRHGYEGDLADGKRVFGLEYNGILFQCATDSDIPGKTRWVQLVTETQKFNSFRAYGTPTTNRGLDNRYPTAYNDSFYDAPAIPTSIIKDNTNGSWEVSLKFDLYLIFRPDGRTRSETEQNEWIPVKLIKWSWAGKAARNTLEDDWYEVHSYEPVDALGREPTQESISEYPTWDDNTLTFE